MTKEKNIEEYIISKQDFDNEICVRNNISSESLEELHEHERLLKTLKQIYLLYPDFMNLKRTANKIYCIDKTLEEINKEITKKEIMHG
jgi:hypothetical protein